MTPRESLMMSKSNKSELFSWSAAIQRVNRQLTDKLKCAIWFSKGHFRRYWSADQRGSLDGVRAADAQCRKRSRSRIPHTDLIRLTSASSLRWLRLWIVFTMTVTPQMFPSCTTLPSHSGKPTNLSADKNALRNILEIQTLLGVLSRFVKVFLVTDTDQKGTAFT